MGPCEYSTKLGPYLDGELAAGQRTLLEAHLRDCADCDAELSEFRGLSRLLAGAGPFLSGMALGRFHRHVSQLQDEQDQADRTARRILRITRVLTGIAACVLVTGSLWLARSRQQTPEDSPTKIAQLPAPSTSPVAPWELAMQPAETAPPATSETASPADAIQDWMVGSLASSSNLTQSGSTGDDDR